MENGFHISKKFFFFFSGEFLFRGGAIFCGVWCILMVALECVWKSNRVEPMTSAEDETVETNKSVGKSEKKDEIDEEVLEMS